MQLFTNVSNCILVRLMQQNTRLMLYSATLQFLSRKKVVATVKRYEGVYNRIAEPSVPFCAKEEQRNECALIFKTKSEQAI